MNIGEDTHFVEVLEEIATYLEEIAQDVSRWTTAQGCYQWVQLSEAEEGYIFRIVAPLEDVAKFILLGLFVKSDGQVSVRLKSFGSEIESLGAAVDWQEDERESGDEHEGSEFTLSIEDATAWRPLVEINLPGKPLMWYVETPLVCGHSGYVVLAATPTDTKYLVELAYTNKISDVPKIALQMDGVMKGSDRWMMASLN
jgi:hypothetical protein